ncbi:MAG: TIGR00341 family protein, partial [Flavobacterium sp.]
MIRYMNYLFNLHRGEDSKEKTLQNVRNNISFAGANLWILACAILIASVGLNVNSTAVIIGAMLISPLMGPIVGSGFALGTFDFDLLKKALKNLLIATVASLVVSTVYFYVSPFKDVQSELLARTSPNIYDILIAFFGGLVGVIAVTRVEKGNPIPGVAIATALMPPLCTAGYGIATGQLNFFLGAFFLYSINCVFICIATYVIVKFLKYPPKKQVDRKHQRQVKYAITILTIIMLVPSTYFAYSLYKEQKYIQAVNNFINDELVATGNTIVYKKTDYKSKVLELAFLDHRFTATEIKELNQKMKFYGLNQTKIIIKQDSTDNIQVLRNSILNEIKGKDEMLDVNE